MQILLDTHIYLWWLSDNKKLSLHARKLIANADIVYVSTVSLWEIGIKIKLGKLRGDIDAIIDGIYACGFRELPVIADHVRQLLSLPLHHHDPFDRMLIAQAMTEPLQLITVDQTLKPYSELVVMS